ncbi:MAG: transcription termination factor Rho, partial [Nocardioidaceae bacterium]|nr:transcription termination factor Rho [Nocardioidaceae bacterium]
MALAIACSTIVLPALGGDTINGRSPDEAKNRVEFTKLTPLYPQERLRLETEPHILTT